jgi:hypothetical protein
MGEVFFFCVSVFLCVYVCRCMYVHTPSSSSSSSSSPPPPPLFLFGMYIYVCIYVYMYVFRVTSQNAGQLPLRGSFFFFVYPRGWVSLFRLRGVPATLRVCGTYVCMIYIHIYIYTCVYVRDICRKGLGFFSQFFSPSFFFYTHTLSLTLSLTHTHTHTHTHNRTRRQHSTGLPSRGMKRWPRGAGRRGGHQRGRQGTYN